MRAQNTKSLFYVFQTFIHDAFAMSFFVIVFDVVVVVVVIVSQMECTTKIFE